MLHRVPIMACERSVGAGGSRRCDCALRTGQGCFMLPIIGGASHWWGFTPVFEHDRRSVTEAPVDACQSSAIRS